MRVAVASLFAFALTAFAYPALACGTDTAVFPQEQPIISRPVQNTTANELIANAQRLEIRAATFETSASERDRRAQQQLAEARALRIEAAGTEGRERSSLLAAASDLAAQAVSNRETAQALRDQANVLRVQARRDRERAIQLVRFGNGGGGGWRGNIKQPVPRSTNVVDL